MTPGNLLLFWNTGQTGQADYFSDSNNESVCCDEVEEVDSECWSREELLDNISHQVTHEPTPILKIKTQVSKDEALNLTKKW